MNQKYKGKAKYVSALASVLLLCITLHGNENVFYKDIFHRYLTSDTLPRKILPGNHKKIETDSLKNTPAADTIITPQTDTINYKLSKEALDAPVFYHADDSIVLRVPAKKIILYGKKNTLKYTDNELSAPYIEFDQQTGLVSAYLTRDSSGKVISFPSYNQGDLTTVSDSIRVNMKTGKGITKGTYTQQGEMYVYGEKIKKIDTTTFFAYKGRFTTCNLDTPHFAFVAKQIKFINQKWAYTGPVRPEVEGVPIPVYLPFGIYPLKQGRHSGLLSPSFTANEQLGLALENLGYYKTLGEKWDVILQASIYSYGSWRASVNPQYYKRYRYRGSFAFSMQHFRDIDKAGTRSFNIRWSHNADAKARPGVSFHADVNAGSSRYNQSIPNNPQRNFENQLNSSITYQKTWKDKPFNLTVSANHNQNTNTKLININLPDVFFNVNPLFPFKRKEPIGEQKWYENISIGLNTNAKSLSSFYETGGNFFKQLMDKFQWGAKHDVPLNISLPPVGNFQFSPNVSYQEHWYDRKLIVNWNNQLEKMASTIIKGFYTAREMNFGMSMSTRIFGMFSFKKDSKVQAIRHQIIPSISINYKPDMNKQFWYSAQTDASGTIQRFSVFDGTIFGPFYEGRFGGINFGVDNNIQMKVRNKKDTAADAVKKITLLDGLSINSSYNFLADSFKLGNFIVSARTNLFDKINITANGTLDPYLTDASGRRIDKLVWSKKTVSLGKLINGSVAVETEFRGGEKGANTPINTSNNNLRQRINPISGLPLNEYEQEAAYIRNNPGEFANFNIPWNIRLSYSFNFYRERNIDNSFKNKFDQSITWKGSLNLTSKWQVGLDGSFNITDKKLGFISMYITRDMHCWQMTINIGHSRNQKFFSINISPKSSLLRDLKINRTRYFYDL